MNATLKSRVAMAVVVMVLLPAAAFPISYNNSIVANSTKAAAAEVCAGETQIGTCIKMVGSVEVAAGKGTPSTYSVDELAFLRLNSTVNGITSRFFPGNGTPNIGVSRPDSSGLACYVLDADPGAAGVLNFTCELSNLQCNSLYNYQLGSSHTTTGATDYSSYNSSATSAYAYTTACAPSATPVVTREAGSASISIPINKGALEQTITFEYGTTTSYGQTAALTSGGTIAAANSGSDTAKVQLTDLTCGTYYYRFSSTTDDGALNGSVTVPGGDFSFALPCPQTVDIAFAPAAAVYGDVFTVSATASSGLTDFAYSTQTPQTCTIDNDELTAVAVGTCVVVAAQAGDNEYLPASRQDSLTIARKDLSVEGLTVQNRAYDGTTAATLEGAAVLQGVIHSDDVTLTGTAVAEFTDKNAGEQKDVNVSGLSLAGDDSFNYQLLPLSVLADIRQYPVTVTARDTSKNVGAQDPVLPYSAASLFGDDHFSGTLARESGETAGTYAILIGSLSAGSNYFIDFEGASLVIQPAASLLRAPLTQYPGFRTNRYTLQGRPVGENAPRGMYIEK